MTARRVALYLAAVLAMQPAHPAGAAPRCESRHWVAAWGASLTYPTTARRALSNQTLRMVVAPHWGGDTVRLRFANRNRDEPLAIGRVTLARRGTGAALARDTIRTVTFEGEPHVAVRPGVELASDPVDLHFEPFDELVVSVHLPGVVREPDEHFITRQTNYVSPAGSGDLTRAERGEGFTPTRTNWSTGWAFLSGLDVLAQRDVGTVVALGDSLTDGFEADGHALVEDFEGMDRNGRYPDFLQRRLLAAGRRLSVVNLGLSGNNLLSDSRPDATIPGGARMETRLATDALSVPGVTHVVILGGINDLGGGADGGEVVRALDAMAARVAHEGLGVTLGTISPAYGTVGLANYGTARTDTRRRAVNDRIRSSGRTGLAVADFDAALRDPDEPRRLARAYDSSDHLHPSIAGYRAMADAVPLESLREPTCRSLFTLPLRVPARYRRLFRAAAVFVRGRRVARLRAPRARTRVRIRAVEQRRVKVRFAIRLKNGRRVRLVRRIGLRP